MSKVLLKLVILFALLVTGSFTVYLIPLVTGISDSVTVTSTNAGDRTILQVNNNADSTSNVSSFLLEVKDGNFKSFNLQNGWIGKKTSPTTVAFVSSNPIKPGESVTFEIKTDQQAPFLIWKALDANNNQLGSGQIGNNKNRLETKQERKGIEEYLIHLRSESFPLLLVQVITYVLLARVLYRQLISICTLGTTR